MEGGAMESDNRVARSEDHPALQGFFSPKRVTFRYLGLLLMCLIGFGSYFCYDNPAALQNYFASELNMPTSKFVLLYSVYAWPNVILCVTGGFLLDSMFGIRRGTIIYMFLSMIGHLIFAIGAYLDAFWLMLVGRFIFGIGAETLAVAQSTYAVLWFKGKELSMVFGLQQSFARIGSTSNFLVMENLYNYVSKTLGYFGGQCIGIILFITAVTCVGSMICTIVLGLMDRHAEIVLSRSDGQKTKLVKLTDIKNFRVVFWLVASICITYYAAIVPFIALGKVYFIEKYRLDPGTANTVNSLVYFIAIVGCPLFGRIVDKTGRNVIWLGISVIGTLIAHGLLAFTQINPYISVSIMGIFYSMLASSLWPLIALIIPERLAGTAYGIAQAIQNLGLAVISILCGIIVENHGYVALEYFFFAWLCITLVTAVIIWISDSRATGGYLSMSPKQRKQYEKNPGDLVSDDRLHPDLETHI